MKTRPMTAAPEWGADLELRRRVADVVRTPSGGWLRAGRSATAIAQKTLAGRAGIKRQAWAQLETSEARGAISLHSLRRAADALGCDLVYFLVPRSPAESGWAKAVPVAVVPEEAKEGRTAAAGSEIPAAARAGWFENELPTELR